MSDKYRAPAMLATLWGNSVNRFMGGRPRASGFRKARDLWGEAMTHVSPGRLSDSLPFSDDGGAPVFSVWPLTPLPEPLSFRMGNSARVMN